MTAHLIQGSDEWHQARLGKVTASRVADVIASTKSGWAASRANYASELICERLTGAPTATYQNDAMRWGTECEPGAREAYAFETGAIVDLAGFIDHPTVEMAGASPDGLIEADGLVEIKCPQTATHLATLRSQKIPGRHVTQMAWQMACTGRSWCDYVSYDPRLPAHLRLFVKRVHADDCGIPALEAQVRQFIAEEVDAVIGALDQLYARAA
ncbi:YqaJ viral recombinase family protein [Brevundimonas sp. 2R-24]|uniref:YqaJ viral recombinase family protein n=1 Tax=Peiella sedimenti TaxID=3061083 RepID=A0ABT8SP88_9CAUL|nr:YqaJ viral recombinase family protein [Caulobacteraceae bacterium XZ-24]